MQYNRLSVGTRLRLAREKYAITQEEAAKRSGYSRSAIQRWEQFAPLDINRVFDLCEVYDANPLLILFSDSEILAKPVLNLILSKKILTMYDLSDLS